jgi:hypothetical protein
VTTSPRWIDPHAAAPDWPVELVRYLSLGLSIGVPADWTLEPVTGLEARIAVYRGGGRAEHLAIQVVDDADPSRPVGHWMDAILALAALPAPELVTEEAHAELIELTDDGPATEYARRLDADDGHLFHGLALVDGSPPELARLYVALLRRGTRAWRLSLSLASACPPGSPDELIDANDHVRAAATYGRVELH